MPIDWDRIGFIVVEYVNCSNFLQTSSMALIILSLNAVFARDPISILNLHHFKRSCMVKSLISTTDGDFAIVVLNIIYCLANALGVSRLSQVPKDFILI